MNKLFLIGSVVAASVLLAGCNDKLGAPVAPPVITVPTPPPASRTLSEFAASLIAMVTGAGCATAAPADVNSVNLTLDEITQDANGINPACG
jgi:outer membrane murein-binding lipoprotein Lpp